MYIRICALLLTTLIATCTTVSAKELFVCGNLNGHAYYMASDVIPKDQAGWRPDEVTSRVTIVGDDKGVITDIKIHDHDRDFSYKEAGCSVTPLQIGDKSTVIMACPPIVETYMLVQDPNGSITLFVSRSKSSSAITSVSAMVGKCSVF